MFKLPASAASTRVVRCSLLEDEQEDLPTVRSGDSLRLDLSVRPFEVITLKLEAETAANTSSRLTRSGRGSP